MARRFGYSSSEITLFPIGGLARFQAIPERPAQELAVALTGPAVNLVIAGLLVGVLGLDLAYPNLVTWMRPEGLPPKLATVNLVLALFNLLPAFPMDGGRVMRALLAVFLGRARATQISAGVGQILAIGLGAVGAAGGNALLILIGLFVFVAASPKAKAVRLERAERVCQGSAGA